MRPRNAIATLLFGLGFLSIGFQILLMREFLIVFYGNELVIGIVLSIWMLLTGCGALLTRCIKIRDSRNLFLTLTMIMAGIWPVIAVFSLHLMKAKLVPPGAMAAITDVALWGVAVQSPFCLASGFLFSMLSSMPENPGASAAFSWESVGSIVASGVVNFILLWKPVVFQSVVEISALWLLLIVIIMLRNRFWLNFSFAATSLLVFLMITRLTDLDKRSDDMLFPGQTVVTADQTPYGKVVITRTDGQFNFYGNGLLLFSSGNAIRNEEVVHPAMIQHPHPGRVLVISGGFAGTLEEILKYNPDVIDYLELNPSLAGIGERFTRQFRDPSIRVIREDARRYLKTATQKYDVVIVDLPPPSSIQINRYYTSGFLDEVKKRMTAGAVISFSLPTASDYVSEQGARLNSVIWNTIGRKFDHVVAFPLERNILVASDGPVGIDLPAMIDRAGISTVWVNKYYLDAGQLKERAAYLESRIIQNSAINDDFTPVAVRYQMAWWMSHFTFNPLFLLILIILVFSVIVLHKDALATGLFSAGFTLASSEIIMLLACQVIFGYVYHMIGMIIMFFMAGLALGAWLGPRLVRRNHWNKYLLIQALLVLFGLTLPLLLILVGSVSQVEIPSFGLLLLFCSVPACLVGMEYHLAVTLSASGTATAVSKTYAADLFGSALGALTMGAVFIPLLGIMVSCLILAGINLVAAVFLWARRRNLVTL